MIVHPITSLEVPQLLPYKTLRRPEEHLQQNIFVVEGEKVVRRLLESELEVVSLLLTPQWFEVYQPLVEKRKENGFEVFVGEKSLLDTIVGFNLHQGIMAIVKVPQTFSVEGIAKQTSQPFLFVALDGIANAENMGMIVRNCSAFGVDCIIVGETSCSPYLRRAVRNSMGTIFKMKVVHSKNLANDLQFLTQKYSTNIIAAHPQEGSIEIQKIKWEGNLCIVFGSEGDGISKNILDVCNTKVTIPMHNETDSLNVGSAVAVVLWETRRKLSMNNE
ncbi:MAG: RNA methyltransferase [Ignavibacteriales bacterium]|nr:RNA methyltransferase [Ignavibacteriales bacterium]